MTARVLASIAFWLLMIPIILGSIVFVVGLYLPFVVLKALWLTVTGRLHEAIGSDESTDAQDAVRPHVG